MTTQVAPSGWSARRLNRLAAGLGAKEYLEVGVDEGRTFARIAVERRTGVDPHFKFDVSAVANDSTRLEQCTSDQFFSALAPAHKYDLVFLDGLHTFEQTYRDFCSAIIHTHTQSAILIDDTVPSDVYSSLPVPHKAIAYRARFSQPNTAWHGDTYKVVYAIHDFHIGWKFRTITDGGNPQTLAWRSETQSRKPSLNSLEAISRLSFFDMLESQDVLNFVSEDVAIEMCLAELTADSVARMR